MVGIILVCPIWLLLLWCFFHSNFRFDLLLLNANFAELVSEGKKEREIRNLYVMQFYLRDKLLWYLHNMKLTSDIEESELDGELELSK